VVAAPALKRALVVDSAGVVIASGDAIWGAAFSVGAIRSTSAAHKTALPAVFVVDSGVRARSVAPCLTLLAADVSAAALIHVAHLAAGAAVGAIGFEVDAELTTYSPRRLAARAAFCADTVFAYRAFAVTSTAVVGVGRGVDAPLAANVF